jgi:hypothetical protein
LGSRPQIEQARLSLTAAYPDPVLTNPNGWKVGAKANSTMVVITPTSEPFRGYNQVRVDTKLAPAIGIVGTNVLTNQADQVVYSQSEAYSRPGLQYGVTLSKVDQQLINTSECWG